MKIRDIDFNFIILNVDRNKIGLRATVNSIKTNYSQPYLCVVDKDIEQEDFDEMNLICKTFKAKDTIQKKMEPLDVAPSLINKGIIESEKDWNLIIISGTHVRPNIKKKLDLFAKNDWNILYPVFDNKFNFSKASINGILMHKKAIQQVGEWPTKMWKENHSSLQLSKDFWYNQAVEQGYVFKGIAGMRLC
jgi:dGTP triphosphohydrolase